MTVARRRSGRTAVRSSRTSLPPERDTARRAYGATGPTTTEFRNPLAGPGVRVDTARMVREPEFEGVEIDVLGDSPSDEEVAAVAALVQAVQDDDRPDDPPVSVAELAGVLRHPSPSSATVSVVARAGDSAVGWLVAFVDQRPANAGFTELDEVQVHPAWRRRGIATAMVRVAADELARVGSRLVMAWPHDEAGRRVAEGLGLTFRQHERESRLRIADVDRRQLGSWVEAPTARSAGYRVVTFRGPVPDELVEAWATAEQAMSDAPLDDIEYTYEPVTPEWVRAVEAVHQARGYERFGAVALAPDGTGAGMSLLNVHPDRPRVAHQEDTAVVPAHRGFGLGRWLKAANLLQLLDAVPEVELVQTYNAESNGPMLDINVAMGFRPSRGHLAHQGPLADVRRALGLDG
jgi:mycothiol synthase